MSIPIRVRDLPRLRDAYEWTTLVNTGNSPCRTCDGVYPFLSVYEANDEEEHAEPLAHLPVALITLKRKSPPRDEVPLTEVIDPDDFVAVVMYDADYWREVLANVSE